MSHTRERLRIGILAGEASGDILGAALLAEFNRLELMESAVGVGGPLMQAQGCRSLFEMERLAVMGLVEPLKRLPELLRMRSSLSRQLAESNIDLFIGIDAPDFNLGLEEKLRALGVPAVHLVSPSVWAWRKKRINKIKRSVDLMLTLFPFELDIYRQHDIPAVCIGHPLADELNPDVDRQAYRGALGIDSAAPVIALMPGSRKGEVALHTPLFLEAARLCLAREPALEFVLPAANAERHQEIAQHLSGYPDLSLKLIQGRSQDVMAAADAVLLASGTATLECTLLGTPMVVAYRMGALSHAIISRMLQTPFVALPNLLAGKELVPEFIQDKAHAVALSSAILEQLNPDRRTQLQEEFRAIHLSLRKNAGLAAVKAILSVPGIESEAGDGPA